MALTSPAASQRSCAQHAMQCHFMSVHSEVDGMTGSVSEAFQEDYVPGPAFPSSVLMNRVLHLHHTCLCVFSAAAHRAELEHLRHDITQEHGWEPSARMLIDCVAAAGRSCAELGCGTGLVGICLSRLRACKSVILTDGNWDSLKNCCRNLQHNGVPFIGPEDDPGMASPVSQVTSNACKTRSGILLARTAPSHMGAIRSP